MSEEYVIIEVKFECSVEEIMGRPGGRCIRIVRKILVLKFLIFSLTFTIPVSDYN